jgi:probable addiction module antidote protein
MARVTGSISGKKARRSLSSLSQARKKASPRTSKGRSDIGRIIKKEAPASVPYEAYLHPQLRKDFEFALGYLAECFNDDYEETFLAALRHVVQAYGGVAKVAKVAGLNRESLYKALSRGGNPGVNTLRKILAALKIKIEFVRA